MNEEIEIIKQEISVYFICLKRLEKLEKERDDLWYELGGVKGIDYSKIRSSANYLNMGKNKLRLSSDIEKKEIKIEELEKKIKDIQKKIRLINEKNEKKIIKDGEIMPSIIVLNVLCKRMTYKDACKRFGFKSTSSLYNYIDRVIERII